MRGHCCLDDNSLCFQFDNAGCVNPAWVRFVATHAMTATAVKEQLHRAEKHPVEANNMTIRPLSDRLVVKRIENQETTRNGIFIPDSAKEKPQEGEVIAVGHGKRLEDGTRATPDVKVGDRIMFGKYSGSDTKLDGTEYIIMREDDVFGILDAPLKKAS
jgi:chaperonin GroES